MGVTPLPDVIGIAVDDVIGIARPSNWHKLNQNPAILRQLEKIQRTKLVCLNKGPFWGCGPYAREVDIIQGKSFMGDNRMGQDLMDIRSALLQGLPSNPPYTPEKLPCWWAGFPEEVGELFPHSPGSATEK